MNYKKSLFWAIIFIVPAFSVSSENLSADTIPDQILQQFNEYNAAIASNLNSEELSKYFAKELNEFWLGWLLGDDSFEMLQKSQKSINNRLRFGQRITNIYECSIKKKNDDIWSLSFIYETAHGANTKTYELDYVLSRGEWHIRSTLADSTHPNKPHSGSAILRGPGDELNSCSTNE